MSRKTGGFCDCVHVWHSLSGIHSISVRHPVNAFGLGLDEFDVQERIGRNPLEADIALGVDQDRAVQRLAFEIVVGLIELEELAAWGRPEAASGT